MKKTELVQFKEEYESAVRNVDEIINNPYTAILLKYKKAEESNYCIKFRQYALRYWGQLHGVDFSEFGDKDITVDEFNHALSMAQIEKKTDFEGGGGNAENNIIDQIKRRLNVILFGVVKPEDDRKIKIGKDAILKKPAVHTAYRKILIINILSRSMWKQSIQFMGKMLHRRLRKRRWNRRSKILTFHDFLLKSC